jgi:site-specific DNA-cytosine methylase
MKQVGNAVPPLLAKEVATIILNDYNKWTYQIN